MYKYLSLAVFLTILATPAEASKVKDLLKQADEFRLPAGALQVLTKVETYKSSKLDKEWQYQVYLKPGRRSLVLSKSPVEKGQKVLMVGDDFWLVLPSSQRPIRITPAQKLLGDASIGDIATMNWSEDYDGVVAGEAVVNNTPCVRLDVRAQRQGVTYQRIELFLAKSNGQPIQANFYVASEKMTKRATFMVEDVEGRPQVTAMKLADQIETDHETWIRYVKRSRRSVPDEFYNPMFLALHEPTE